MGLYTGSPRAHTPGLPGPYDWRKWGAPQLVAVGFCRRGSQDRGPPTLTKGFWRDQDLAAKITEPCSLRGDY